MQEYDKRTREFNHALRFVAPGTQLREGLEHVLRARTGGLIVVGCSPEMRQIVDGGFSINCEFTPAHLYELAKMDGGIVLSEDARRILFANTQWFPPASIPTSETGTRHRTAQRTAVHTNHLVIAISQRRNVVTLYQGNFRYELSETGVILAKANQAVATLEKYKSVLDQSLTNLGALEFEELVSLHDVASVLQRIEMVLRIKEEIANYSCELGTEGRLVSMQLAELVSNIEEEARMLIRDYSRNPDASVDQVLRDMKKLSSDEMMEISSFLRVLGYTGTVSNLEESVSPRGYRILLKIPRLPAAIITNLVQHFHNLPRIMMATIEELDDVDGIGEVRARAIKDGLKRIQQQVFIDRHI
ncbi:DNA integrity scanning diadenylate cyclase DisA [Brevibacillus sp. TJ4]|uniref:DNA integrity scanning diadenylate cyclase DisA n=1 Tax=Brevibacillus sp. TJ4 TaxID=3234853 RepID=UPI003BA146F2